MPLLGFTVMRDLIESGAKRQTIRLPRKRPIQVGDTLYLYWKPRTTESQRIGVTRCVDKRWVPWWFIRDDARLAARDGFPSLEAFQKWFESRYHLGPLCNTEFDIIRWDYPFQVRIE